MNVSLVPAHQAILHLEPLNLLLLLLFLLVSIHETAQLFTVNNSFIDSSVLQLHVTDVCSVGLSHSQGWRTPLDICQHWHNAWVVASQQSDSQDLEPSVEVETCVWLSSFADFKNQNFWTYGIRFFYISYTEFVFIRFRKLQLDEKMQKLKFSIFCMPLGRFPIWLTNSVSNSSAVFCEVNILSTMVHC